MENPNRTYSVMRRCTNCETIFTDVIPFGERKPSRFECPRCGVTSTDGIERFKPHLSVRAMEG